MDIDTQLPDDVEAPPEGCEWKHATLLKVGDEIFLGNHRIFDKTEPYFGEILELVEKPKTYTVTFKATHERLYGQRSAARIRKDEWTAIRTPR